ncbi:MAG: hypothetical protein Q4A17_09400 [Thermoguttaceae bacterium]|nr:hypothetical protein [Thermoguttaceae bacterium]MDO4858145.1 hypothetical protein [Thermoguttaceae bacterium]
MRKNQKKRGVLSFEWIILCVLLIVGIMGGLVTARNAFLSEIDDTIDVVNLIDANFVTSDSDGG